MHSLRNILKVSLVQVSVSENEIFSVHSNKRNIGVMQNERLSGLKRYLEQISK